MFRHLVLGVVLGVLALRLLGFVHAFWRESVQVDFASYYTAGRSLDAGLSPYENHVATDPGLWDGVNVFRHSRFLYPPLAARAFQPLSHLSYANAKLAWMLSSLAALSVSLALAYRLAGIPRDTERILWLAIAACGFFPLLALLERGQVDGLTLALILAAFTLMRRRRSSYASGALLALATLFKLNCAFLLPFLLIRRRWRVLAGFALGGLVLFGADLVVDGPRRVLGYVTDELPRIGRHGEGGTREMALPRSSFTGAIAGLEPGRSVMDGETYDTTYFRFVLNAGLVQTPWLRSLRGESTSLSSVAVSLLGGFFVVLGLWQRRCGLPFGEPWRSGEDLYWQSVLVLILLCGPVTWAMNTVWLLALVPVWMREVRAPDRGSRVLFLVIGAAGWLLVAVPDGYAYPALAPFGPELWSPKYVVGELLCLIGLLGLWRPGRISATA